MTEALTVEDIVLIEEGLDVLPEKGLAAAMTQDLLKGIMGSAMNDEGRKKIEDEMKANHKKMIQDNARRKDKIVLVRAKLINLRAKLTEEAVSA